MAPSLPAPAQGPGRTRFTEGTGRNRHPSHRTAQPWNWGPIGECMLLPARERARHFVLRVNELCTCKEEWGGPGMTKDQRRQTGVVARGAGTAAGDQPVPAPEEKNSQRSGQETKPGPARPTRTRRPRPRPKRSGRNGKRKKGTQSPSGRPAAPKPSWTQHRPGTQADMANLTQSERAELMRTAHQALLAEGALPIATSKRYNRLLDAAIVPGRPDLTLERYVAYLHEYRELNRSSPQRLTKRQKRKAAKAAVRQAARARAKAIKDKEAATNPAPSTGKASSSETKQKMQKVAKSKSKKKPRRPRSIKAMSGGLPGLGRRR